MITLDVKQGSDEWFKARVGVISASKFDKIITSTGNQSTQYRAYMNTLIAETMIDKKADSYQSALMTRGIELEPEARNYYEFDTDRSVKEIGLVYLNKDKRVSCSPDGLMSDRGLEIKCPNETTQIEYLRAGKLPTKYVAQVQGSMLVTGLKKWDFLSYHPELNQLLVTVKADEEFQDKLMIYLCGFITEMNEALKQLTNEKAD